MNLEGVTLSEMLQSQTDKCIGVHLYEVCGVVKFTNTESRMVATRDWGAVRRGRGTEGLAFNGFRVWLWEGEGSSVDGQWGCLHNNANILHDTESYT